MDFKDEIVKYSIYLYVNSSFNEHLDPFKVYKLNDNLLQTWSSSSDEVVLIVFKYGFGVEKKDDYVAFEKSCFRNVSDRSNAPNNQVLNDIISKLKQRWSSVYSGNHASWMTWAVWITSRFRPPEFNDQINTIPPQNIFDLFCAVREPADIRLASQRSSVIGAQHFAGRVKRKLDQFFEELDSVKKSVSRLESCLNDMKHFVDVSLDTYEEVQNIQSTIENDISRGLFCNIENQEDVDHTD